MINQIKFEKGKEIPQKMKDWIKENGIRVPFNPRNFSYSNKELDSWLVVKDEKGVKYKMDRTLGKLKKITAITK